MAKLAGIPKSLLERAQEKLFDLEAGNTTGICVNTGASDSFEEITQLSFFAPDSVAERIRNLNLMEITPSQAIKILEELKEEVHD